MRYNRGMKTAVILCSFALSCAVVLADSADDALALCRRTRDYVAKSVPAGKLRSLVAEMESDARWLAQTKNPVMREAIAREIRRVRREILFLHPDLQFTKLLAVQRGVPVTWDTHMADQYLGRWSRPGDGLVVLEDWKTAPRKTKLLDGKLPTGTVLNPDLHWDADRIVFAFCDHTRRPEADARALKVPTVAPGVVPDELDRVHRRFFLYECAADGSWVKQLTGCAGDPMETCEGRQTVLIEDVDPCYLPDGGILFCSTRSQNFGRCHWGRYVPAFLLYRMNGDGSGIHQFSFGEANEWEPTVLNDGRIAYTRWDYINRNAIWYQSLWTVRPDGTGVAHLYGNYSKTMAVTTDAKAIPNSPLVVGTAGAHHFITGGSLFLLDARKGEDGEAPLTRLTPEVPFVESEGWQLPGHYLHPMPVNDTLFFAAYTDEPLGYPKDHPKCIKYGSGGAWPSQAAYGIWLVDTLGGRELIYKDAAISTFNPIPMVPRKKPPVLASSLPPADKAPDWGVCYVENVYDSRVDLPKGSVAALRLNKLINMPATRRETLQPGPDLELYKEQIGVVPVAADGSCAFRVPAGVPVQLQAVDTNGVAILTMRSFIYTQKGEWQGCAGCHENKNASRTPVKRPVDRPVSVPKPELDLGYPGALSYARTIQPIFDRHCISCHGLGKAPDFIGTNGIRRLVQNKQVALASSYKETAYSTPYDYFAGASKLLKRIDAGHGGAKLSKDERTAIVLWLDFNVPEYSFGGGYGWNRPELRLVDPEGEKALRAAIAVKLGADIAAQPFDALVNRGDEAKSRVLWLCRPEDRAALLALCRKALKPHPAQDVQGTCGRDDACECRSCWVRRGGYNKPVK